MIDRDEAEFVEAIIRSEIFMRVLYLLSGVLIGMLLFLLERNALINNINELTEVVGGCVIKW